MFHEMNYNQYKVEHLKLLSPVRKKRGISYNKNYLTDDRGGEDAHLKISQRPQTEPSTMQVHCVFFLFFIVILIPLSI